MVNLKFRNKKKDKRDDRNNMHDKIYTNTINIFMLQYNINYKFKHIEIYINIYIISLIVLL